MGSTVDQLRGELAEMRTAMDRQQARIEQLEAAAPEALDAPRRSRRQLLKLAGATLAGAAAGAAGIAGSIVPASAATGDPVLAGHSKDNAPDNVSADAATQIDYTEYKEVAGVKLPNKWTSTWTDGQVHWEVTDIQANVQIDAAKFDRPAPAAMRK